MILRTARDVSMLVFMMLYISAMDHARKLKFSSYIQQPYYKQNVTVSVSLRFSDSIQCKRGYYF